MRRFEERPEDTPGDNIELIIGLIVTISWEFIGKKDMT